MRQKLFKRFLSVTLVLSLVVTLMLSSGLTAFAKTFPDVPTSNWAYSDIDDLSNKEIIKGMTDGTFKPNSTISNAEIVTLVVRAYCVANNLALPGNASGNQAWYTPIFNAAVNYKIMNSGQFAGKESTPATRSDIALLISNAINLPVPSDTSAVLSMFADASSLSSVSSTYKDAIAKVADAGIVLGDNNRRFNAANNATRAEAAAMISRYLRHPAAKQIAGGKIMIAAAASLQNVFEKSLIPEFEKLHPDIKVTGTYDSSGKLQTQIESGLEADIFFSAALTQMNALKDKSLINSGSIVNLLENKIVLIGTSGMKTNVTSFNNITDAKSIALGDPASVPAGQYAQEALTSLGIWDAVLAKKPSLGTNVTEVLNWVAAGSAEVGIVYATDAASNKNVEVIAEAPAGSLKAPVLYPIGITTDSKNVPQSELFLSFLQSQTAIAIFESYGFSAAK